MLKANRIDIPKSKAGPSFEKLDSTFDTIKYLLTLFHSIELTNVNFSNNTFKVVYVDNILYITSKDYEIAGTIHRKGQKYIADVPMLYIKKGNIDIAGELVYDSGQETLDTKGTFSAYHINGRFKALYGEHKIDFALNSDTFTDIRTLAYKLPLKQAVQEWIAEKIKVRQYRLYSLMGNFKVHDDNISLDLETLKGSMLAEEVNIHFHKALSPVEAKNFIMTYGEGALHFDFKAPSYEKRDMNGSKVHITKLLGSAPTGLKLDLHVNSPFDEKLQKILQTYKLHIPVVQGEGTAHSSIILDIVFNTGDTTAVIESAFKNAVINIYKAKFPVVKGELHYEKGKVDLHDVTLKEDWYEGTVNGEVDLQKEKADFKFNAHQVQIGGKNSTFFEINKKLLSVKLDFRKKITISVPELKMKMINDDQKSVIKVESIEKIKPYLKNLGLEVNGGRFDIVTKDFQTLTFKGELRRDSCFFYDKKDVCHTRVPFSVKVSKDKVHFYAFEKRLHYNAQKSQLDLQKINVDLEAFLESRKTFEKLKSSKKSKETLNIRGKKSDIRYRRHTLLTDKYTIKVRSNGNIKAVGNLGKDVVTLSKKGNTYAIEALRIRDRMLHPLIDFAGLKEGRYSFTIQGDPEKEMKGRILVEGGVMKDFKTYNNVLAFLNTLPAMVTFSSPGFSNRGYKIKKGNIDYRLVGDLLIFDTILIEGWSSTIAGKGKVDLKKHVIHMDLAIRTARELGAVVGKIPLLGYILMGEDESMTIGLKINGSLNDPKVETSTVEDILTSPLNILKRTLESPVHLMNKGEKETRGGDGKNREKKRTPNAYEQLGLEDPASKKEKKK